MKNAGRVIGAVACAALVVGVADVTPASAKSGVGLGVVGQTRLGRQVLVAAGGDDDPSDHAQLCIQRLTSTPRGPRWTSLKCVALTPPHQAAAVSVAVSSSPTAHRVYRAAVVDAVTGRTISTSPRVRR